MEARIVKLADGRTLEVRQAKQEDADQLLAFLPSAFEETDCLLMTRKEFDNTLDQGTDFLGKIAASQTQLALVGILDHVLVAVLTFTVRDLERVRHAGEVGLIVSKDSWGCGIGKTMMSCLHQSAEGNSETTKIDLRVRLSNRRAIKLYENLGYQVEGWIRKAVKIGDQYDDHYWMGKEMPFDDRY